MTSRSTRSPRRRTVVALAIVLSIMVTFVIRLVDIQVVNAQTNIDDSLRYGLGVTQTLTGTRGAIVDANGTTLASSTLKYDCQMTPVNVSDTKQGDGNGHTVSIPWSQMSDRIAAIIGSTGDKVRGLITDALAQNKYSQYALLQNGLSTEQYRKLMELGTDFISCSPQPSRSYPNGAVAGNLLGFMGSDGKALAGLELSANQCLTPTNGKLSFEAGKDGVIIPGTESEKPAVDGGTLTLTIDTDLQWYMDQLIAQGVQKMGAKYGTITVTEVKTGKVRAMAEYPTVDPNDINASNPDAWYSKIFTDQFEPGSTFKGLLASMLIDKAGQTPTSTAIVSDPEHFPNGATVVDSFHHPTYDYTLAGVLIDSSNAGASVFSQRMSLAERYDFLKKFGIGTGSDIDFPGQTRGIVHPWQDWDNQMRYDTSYGQGLTTTVPELVEAYDAIANDGVRVPLSLVESCTTAAGKVIKPTRPESTRVISAKTSAQVREILENVAMQAVYKDLVKIPGYRIATKTGTGQISNGGKGYIRGRYYTTMIGFAPANDPQYIVAVTLDQPTAITSSTANASTFKAAMEQVLKTYRIMPSTAKPTILSKFG
ncbi:MAG TPA: penicillin-binding protein 2 [Microbacterium sp.]|nr:penicillin-binding protein 2 [Microbacterium sp.]